MNFKLIKKTTATATDENISYDNNSTFFYCFYHLKKFPFLIIFIFLLLLFLLLLFSLLLHLFPPEQARSTFPSTPTSTLTTASRWRRAPPFMATKVDCG